MRHIIPKFKFKDKGIVLYAPTEIEKEFEKLGFKTDLDKKGKSTNTLVFINNNKEYTGFLKTGLQKIETNSVLWFAYPKGTLKTKTDINRDPIPLAGEELGIMTVTAISINDTWSALRFRPVDKVGK